MNDTTNYTALAEELGVSKSTVSKVLRHCGGVDTDTRNRILRAAGEMDPAPAQEDPGAIPVRGGTGAADVYVILPDTPSFFWQTLLHAVSDEAGARRLSTKCNVYTRLTDSETVMAYLDEAERLGARVIILAAAMNDALRARLSALALGRLVILLCEKDEIVNTFYVGAEAYADGAAMGRRWLDVCAGSRLIVMTPENNPNVRARVEGFLDTVQAAGYKPFCVRAVPTDDIRDRKTFPAHLAAMIDAVLPPERDGVSLYVPFGFAQLVRAADKAGLGTDTVCLTHDYLASHDRCGSGTRIRVISCDQDLEAQAKRAVALAERCLSSGGLCPDEKYIHIPSVIRDVR